MKGKFSGRARVKLNVPPLYGLLDWYTQSIDDPVRKPCDVWR